MPFSFCFWLSFISVAPTWNPTCGSWPHPCCLFMWFCLVSVWAPLCPLLRPVPETWCKLSAISCRSGCTQHRSYIPYPRYRKNYIFFFAVVLGCPVIIFFVSTIKPHLFHIAANSLIFALIFLDQTKRSEKENLLKYLFSINITILKVCKL